MSTNCYCCSNKSFSSCCQPIFLKGQIAENPEQLMRSRYCAFCTGNVEYLLYTSSKKLKRNLSEQDLLDFSNSVTFIKLDVLDAYEDKVEFIAHFLIGNVHHQLRELSTFVKENQEFKYDSGVITETPLVKLKRNDPCPCGSGKKYKTCHMV